MNRVLLHMLELERQFSSDYQNLQNGTCHVWPVKEINKFFDGSATAL